MKISRLLTYATLGVITGLLIENQVLAIRRRAVTRALKKKNKDHEEVKNQPRKLVTSA